MPKQNQRKQNMHSINAEGTRTKNFISILSCKILLVRKMKIFSCFSQCHFALNICPKAMAVIKLRNHTNADLRGW